MLMRIAHILSVVYVVGIALDLKSHREWMRYCRSGQRPGNIPAAPHTVYKDEGWQGFGYWLGTGNTVGRGKKPVLLPAATGACTRVCNSFARVAQTG